MLAWLNRLTRDRVTIPDDAWQAACGDIALTGCLPPPARAQLRSHVERFLHDKRFAGAAGLELDDDDCLRIAILACLPVTGLDYDWLRGWREIIVYPAQFRARREEHDEATGVVSESHDWMAGEAWQQGPLILSLDDILADVAEPFAGFNLVVHEIAHKLDMLDGHADGVPPLPAAARRQWLEIFQREYTAFVAAVAAGEETFLDPYAAEAPDEFFAVASETYFSAPALLAQAHPDIHAQLKAFYGVELDCPVALPDAGED
ncbi:MAG: zinc-dependent peptidase [Xanthomonadales bacterium]|nr:zinc-dependent peptidase [Xanthomonadales bacterium]